MIPECFRRRDELEREPWRFGSILTHVSGQVIYFEIQWHVSACKSELH